VAYLVAGGHNSVFDPAVGAGAFFRAAKALEQITGRRLTLYGSEIDASVLDEARASGLTESDLAHVEITDFVLRPPSRSFEGIVANPPYIRHHRLPPDVKEDLKALCLRITGRVIDGRAGLHVYFLIRALQLLEPGGRLVFIVPSDTCEGIFADRLWAWIAGNHRLDAVITFAPEATPFPGVDTNPVILMIAKQAPTRHYLWARCAKAGTEDLRSWVLSGFRRARSPSLSVRERELSEGLGIGVSRQPIDSKNMGPAMGRFAKVVRGIATGANEFFFLTVDRVRTLEIPSEFLVPAVGRTRDVPGEELTTKIVRGLEAKGRPTLLFSPDDRPILDFPRPVRDYIRKGEEMGIAERALVATRRPWYKMEVRQVPPILFAYLGRRNARFVRNLAGVVPLTGFLCIYPLKEDEAFIDKLWQVLQHPATRANLALVGKSYGAGAIKVEPRALEALPLPAYVISEVELESVADAPPALFSYDTI